mgnify:CR=1 FL=1
MTITLLAVAVAALGVDLLVLLADQVAVLGRRVEMVAPAQVELETTEETDQPAHPVAGAAPVAPEQEEQQEPA